MSRHVKSKFPGCCEQEWRTGMTYGHLAFDPYPLSQDPTRFFSPLEPPPKEFSMCDCAKNLPTGVRPPRTGQMPYAGPMPGLAQMPGANLMPDASPMPGLAQMPGADIMPGARPMPGLAQMPGADIMPGARPMPDQDGIIGVPLHDVALAPPAASPKHLTYNNGHLLTSVRVYTIFWGAAWQQASLTPLITHINQFFDAILSSSLIDLLGEYSVAGQTIGHGSRIGTTTITNSEPGGGSLKVTDAQLQSAIQGWMASGTIPHATPNTLFFVYLPPNVTAVDPFGDQSCVQMCGYHWFIAGAQEVYYAIMPYPCPTGCVGALSVQDALTSTSSHELCEAITDPHPFTGWNDSVNGEIGDLCAWQTGTVNGFTVQKEWSNAQSACVLAPVATGGWASLGGVITTDPCAGRNADGRIELFARGTDNAVWHIWQNSAGGGWSGWASLGGVITSNIAVSSNRDGRLEAFARGTDKALWHIWQNSAGGGWSGWASLGGVITTDPSVSQNADGRLEAFARGTDNAVWHIWQNSAGGGWSGWASLGGVITSNIAVSANRDGRLEVFARGTDNALWHIWQNSAGGGWSGWASLGGAITSDPAVGRNADGRLEVFARGTDNAVWHIWQTSAGGGWSGWASLGGVITSDIAVSINRDGRLEIFARGTDNAAWHIWQNSAGGGWSSWASLGGAITSNPAQEPNLDGRLEVFVRGTDNALWHRWQVTPGGGWS